ncbi:MAG: class I SAM-dependent methyltransferase [Flavobacterium sp.]|jgi:2-polyprenyl-3-methyl-5-hydroxy-6-metoxy-1,4-benzoquinol methylase|uniref:class I SAM-dependent methyltransferase n=1 Tax=Flavobacterium sp. TaxID=239 RepID=UPI003D09F559
MKSCILCKSERIKVYQEIEFELLKKIYLDTFNIDISKEIEVQDKVKLYQCKNCKLDFFNPKLAGKGSFYEELQLKRDVYYSPDRIEFDEAAKFIDKGQSVLEIGSGSGFFAQKINIDNYVGLEFNDEAIKKAAENGIKLIKKSIEDYAEEDQEKFDVVCSFHVLEHVQDPQEFLKSSIKKLNDGGKLIIAVPCNDSVLTSNHNHILNLPPHHITRWTLNSLHKLTDLFDLKLVDYKVISISKVINKKLYFEALLLKNVLNVLYPKNRVVIDPKKIYKVERWTNFFLRKVKPYKMFDQKKLIGENVMFVFEKKSN